MNWLGNNWRSLISYALRAILGLVMLIAGLLKLVDLEASGKAVRAYLLFPDQVSDLLGILLPCAEIILGIFLLAGLFTRISAVLVALMLAAFIFGIARAWMLGISIDCGCFGGGGYVAPDETKYPQEIARDAALLVGAVLLAVLGPGRLALDAWLRPAKVALPETEKETNG